MTICFHINLLVLLLFTPCVAMTYGQDENSSADHGLASRPNFVVILTDDQGYGDLSCFGSKNVQTPRIDQMAAEGAKLTSFYMAAPYCTPSRGALLTGSYPRRIGMTGGV